MRNLIVVCSAIVVLTAGCMKAPDPSSGAAMGSQLKPTVSDAKLEEAVKELMAADPELKKETIIVKAKDGRVTLEGSVSNDRVRARADEVAREVPDVFGVDTEKLATK